MRNLLTGKSLLVLLAVGVAAFAQPEERDDSVLETAETELSTPEMQAADLPESEQRLEGETPELPASEQPEAMPPKLEQPEQPEQPELPALEQPEQTEQPASVSPPLESSTVSTVSTVSIAAQALERSEKMPSRAVPHALSSAWLAGAYVSYNAREGYRKYDGVEGYQRLRLDNGNFLMFGGAAGKRFALRDPRLRAQAAVDVGWGSVFGGRIDLREKGGGIIKGDLYENFWIGAAQGEMHYLFPSGDGRNYFLSAGPGAHVSSYYETVKVDKQTVAGSSWLFMASLNFNVGAGMEYKTSDNRAVSIRYNLRLWEPLHIIETGELFPMGVDYREFFFTHMLRVEILLPEPRHKKFYW